MLVYICLLIMCGLASPPLASCCMASHMPSHTHLTCPTMAWAQWPLIHPLSLKCYPFNSMVNMESSGIWLLGDWLFHSVDLPDLPSLCPCQCVVSFCC